MNTTTNTPAVKPCTLRSCFDAWRRVHDAETEHGLDTALAALYDELVAGAGEPAEEDRRWWAEQSAEYDEWLDAVFAAQHEGRCGLDDSDMCSGRIG